MSATHPDKPGDAAVGADEQELSPGAVAFMLLVYFLGVRLLFLSVHGWLEVAYVPAVAFMALLGVSRGFYKRWLFWRPRPRLSPRQSVLETVVAVFGLVVTFTIATTVLVKHRWLLHVGGYHAALPGKLHLAAALERDFLWNFLKAIPALDLPSTLNWPHPAHPLTGYSGGAVILAFKLLVIIPVIGLMVELINRAQTGKTQRHEHAVAPGSTFPAGSGDAPPRVPERGR